MTGSYFRRTVYTTIEETVYVRSPGTPLVPSVVLQRARRPPPATTQQTPELHTPPLHPGVVCASPLPPPDLGLVRQHKVPTPSHESSAHRSSSKARVVDTPGGSPAIVERASAPVATTPVAPVVSSDSPSCERGCLSALAHSGVSKFQTLVINASAISEAAIDVSPDRSSRANYVSVVSNVSPGELLSILESVALSSETHVKTRGYPPPRCAHKSRLVLTGTTGSCTKYIVSVVPHSTDGIVFNFSPIGEARSTAVPGVDGAQQRNHSAVALLQPMRALSVVGESAPETTSTGAPMSTAMVLRSAEDMQVGFAPLSSLKFT